MRHLILTCIFVILILNVSGQGLGSLSDGKKACWQYLNLTDSFQARIISYFPNDVLCGKLPSASIEIVELITGDTIRVIQFCSRIENIKTGDFIMAYPHKHTDMKNVILPSDDVALTCKIPRTVNATLKKRY